METIYARQYELGKEIEQMASNFKKDSVARKTEEYVTKRLNSLQSLWMEFLQNHTQLLPGDAASLQHAYFTKKYFNHIQQVYESLKSWLTETRATFQPATSNKQSTAGSGDDAPPNTASSVTDPPTVPNIVEKLVREQRVLMQAVEHFLNDLGLDSAQNRPRQYYSLKIERLIRYENEMRGIDKAIWVETHQEDPFGYTPDQYHDLEHQIQDAIIALQEMLDSLVNPELSKEENNSQHTSTRIKLPKIALPTFDGNYLQWVQFHDLYTQLIHSQPISNAEKMFYLISNLSGEARALITHLPVTHTNYETAWNIIINRYDNKRLLINAILTKLLSQPSLTSESATAIKRLHDTTNECLHGLQNLGISVDNWDPILIHLLIRKVDNTTHTLYEQSLENPKEIGTMRGLLQFLEARFQALEAIIREGGTKRNNPVLPPRPRTSLPTVTTSRFCILCPQQTHQLFNCRAFRALVPAKRRQLLIDHSRCLNCLRSGHSAEVCTLRSCLKCNKRHNTLIHEDDHTKGEGKGVTHAPPPSSLKSTTLAARTTTQKPGYILLGTATVRLQTPDGKDISCKALLDCGSQLNIITERLAKKLNVTKVRNPMAVQGIGQDTQRTNSRANVLMKSNTNDFSLRIEAFVLPRITGPQPAQYMDIKSWKIPANLQLADASFHEPNRIDLLIGAEVFYQLLLSEQHSLGQGLPIMQNTRLGWVMAGKIEDSAISEVMSCNVGTQSPEQFDISQQIEKFWKIEEVSSSKPCLSAAEERCEIHFKQTTQRTREGRFIVRFPFVDEPATLGESKDIALNRFLALEKKLAKNAQLKQQYTEFMEEYLRLNHMQKVEPRNLKRPYYFLPHHFVCKPDSSTTKLRVVFDASAKTSSNTSLNDILAKGPTIQDELFSILLRFRIPRYVFTGDIEKMYRQIKMHKDDQRYQLIYWRDHPEKELEVYQLSTVTYGTKSAPYLATRTLKTLAEDRANQYPLGSEVLKKDFYVDDVMTGSDNITTAVQMQSELISLLNEGGFHLRKWCSNHPRLLERFQPHELEVALDFANESEERIKTLGLVWWPKSDSFSLQTSVQPRKKITKRTAYSDIAHLFDPLGITAPVVVTAKLLLQQTWTIKADWDDPLPPALEEQWTTFRNSLQELKDFSFPRHVIAHHHPKEIQLHTFADASEKAYGAAIYIRTVTKNDQVIVRLLCAKSRVAPLSKVTLPRLELCAAKLAADLCHRVKADLNLKYTKEFYWSDSEIVLAWLNSPSSSYQTFVANRVAAIQTLTNSDQWRHVSSKDNPADMISRGICPRKFKESTLWFYGPFFLHGAPSVWPVPYIPVQHCSVEKKKSALPITVVHDLPSVITEIRHGNSFTRLKRILAYVLRFTKRLKGVKIHHSHLTAEEVEDALLLIVKAAQQEEFNSDIASLRKSSEPTKNSQLLGLSPFLDEHSILRVGGRVQESSIPYDAKHPMLLPYSHPTTKMLMTELHIKNHHATPQTLLAITRQRFWPIKGKVLARSVVHHCVPCTRAKPKLLNQIMGNLPASRVQPGRPFITSGVDFCGPFWTHFRIRGKKPVKSYIAVFCCFATRAVHLEVVTDLTTEAFLGSLKRFIGRRGHCKDIYCDNATNFVGAKNQLQELSRAIHSDQAKEVITSTCTNKGITFHFIPPRAPHFGGLWEAAVKSAKQLMQHQISSAALTYEELETLAIEIEAILNSRPLTPLSSNPNDPTALTPGHFLIGEPPSSSVDPQAAPMKASLLTRWKLIGHLKTEFWRRWSTEYLHELQQRHKWKRTCQNVEPGTMVVIQEENIPPLKWPLGIILRCIPGKDNQIRVVDIKTATNVIRRPIHKIAPLPVETNDDSRDSQTEDVSPPSEDTSPGTTRRSRNASTDKEAPPDKRRRGVSSLITTALVTLLVLPLARCSQVEIKKFESQPTLYFENLGQASIISNEWELVVYYNLSSYWREYALLSNITNNLSHICHQLEHPEVCLSIIRGMKAQLVEISEGNDMIIHSSSHSRPKRGAINIVGKIANSLFGILDADYADQMTQTIEGITDDQHRIAQLMKNQTSILDSTLNIMRKNYKHIDDQFADLTAYNNEVSTRLSKVNQELHQEKVSAMFTTQALQLALAMNNFRRTQDAIINVLIDAHHGRVNPQILSVHQLQQELTIIREHLPSTLTLPIAMDDVSQFYKLLNVKGRGGSRYVLFQLKLPLVSFNKFELFRIIPVPVLVKDIMWAIQPTTPYMVISLHRDQYYPLEESELHSCALVDENIHLCKQQHPMYKTGAQPNACEMALINQQARSPQCKLAQLTHEPRWIQLHSPNQWIYALSKQTIINVVCGSELKQTTLEGSGRLIIGNDCTIKQPLLTIQAHNIYPSTSRQSYMAIAELITPDQPPQENTTSSPHIMQPLPTADLEELQLRIQAQLKQEASANFRTHHTHHYAVNYISLAIGMLAIGFCCWKFRSCLSKKRPTAEYQVSPRSSPSFSVTPHTLDES